MKAIPIGRGTMSVDPFDDKAVEFERYELREPPAHSIALDADRRGFIQSLGAGMLIVATAKPSPGQSRRARREEPLSERFHIGADGVVTVLTSKVEVGQGSRTQITQAAAEELGLPTGRVRLIMADTKLCPDDGGTAGSRTTPSTVPRVRNAAAALRELLVAHAAERLGVDRAQLKTRDGVFFTTAGNKVTLADLAIDGRLRDKLASSPPSEVALTPTNQWRVLGSSVAKVRGEEVVTGVARYPSDILRPGMLYGKVLRPAAFGATLESIDLQPVRAIDGAVAVREGDFVGIAAPTSWQAAKALEAIEQTAE